MTDQLGEVSASVPSDEQPTAKLTSVTLEPYLLEMFEDAMQFAQAWGPPFISPFLRKHLREACSPAVYLVQPFT